MKLTKIFDFSKVPPSDLPRYLTVLGDNLKSILNNGLTFSDNANGTTLTLTFTQANTDTLFTHNLGRVPSGYKVTRASSGITLYDGSNEGRDWSASTIVLRATATGSCLIELT